MDQRVRRVERRLEDLTERVDAMAEDTNRDRNVGGRRLGVRDAYSGPINRPVAANRWARGSEGDSEDEDDILPEERQPQRRGGNGGGGYRRDYYDEGEEGVEQAYAIKGLMLTPKQEEDSQRHQLFHTRCTVRGRICNLIIDSDIRENIIRRDVVNQLQLLVEKHPNPYRIEGIKTTERIEVKERCSVPFSIGKYQDEIYCDVVDRGACHLLLGKPWQYGVNAQHSSKENVYRLKKGDVKYVLLPLKIESRAKTRRVEESSLSTITHPRAKVGENLKESKVVHAPIVKDVTAVEEEISSKAPEEREDVLEEFKKMIPDELPRGIQHQFDLMLRASQPSLPHYRMSSKEVEILQKVKNNAYVVGLAKESRSRSSRVEERGKEAHQGRPKGHQRRKKGRQRRRQGRQRSRQPKKYRPYRLVLQINHNAYVIGFSNTIGISKIFQVTDLYPFHPGECTLCLDENSGSSSSQVGENDAERDKDNQGRLR